MKGGKLTAKAMSEEEKAEAEAAKNKKPPAPAKGGKKDEEPNAEELEKMEAEKKAREE
jgi:hypothetical protein